MGKSSTHAFKFLSALPASFCGLWNVCKKEFSAEIATATSCGNWRVLHCRTHQALASWESFAIQQWFARQISFLLAFPEFAKSVMVTWSAVTAARSWPSEDQLTDEAGRLHGNLRFRYFSSNTCRQTYQHSWPIKVGKRLDFWKCVEQRRRCSSTSCTHTCRWNSCSCDLSMATATHSLISLCVVIDMDMLLQLARLIRKRYLG